MLEQVDISWRNCSPWRAYTGEGFPERLWRPPMLKHFMKDCIPCLGCTLEQDRSVRRKEHQRGAVTGWAQPLFPNPLLCLVGAGGRAGRSKSNKTGWQTLFYFLVFVSHHSTVFLIGSKLNSFSPSQVCFVHDYNQCIVLSFRRFSKEYSHATYWSLS